MKVSLESRFAGAVCGAAIGDAMGHPTEFIGSFEEIQERFGPNGVTDFELYWEKDGNRFAPFTDDFQLAEVVLRVLMETRISGMELDPAMTKMGAGFIGWANHPQGGHRAPGRACLAGCRALENGKHWSRAGGETAGGCGSVMRVFPFGLIFLDDIKKAETWAVAHSSMTHQDPIALAACAAMTVGIVHVLHGREVEDVLSGMVEAAMRYSDKTGDMIQRAVDEAKTGVEPRVTLQRLQGWAAHEAISAACYVFRRHSDDPRAAILEGANTPGDSDSIATLVGALVGARCGIESIPEKWVREVERSEELRTLAREAFKCVSERIPEIERSA